MSEIDEVIHQPLRLRIMAALAALESDSEVDFSFLRDQLKASDGNLGAHLEKLEAARYLNMRKAFVDRRPKTFLRLTKEGRRAYEDYIESLKKIIGK